jgi:predicted enzyme related to lactoylglutathione lyase
MPAPNLFLVYVTDIERSTAFYSDLFGIEPAMVTPRYVPYDVGGGVLFALWSGRAEQVDPHAQRHFETGLMLPGTAADVDRIHDDWVARGVAIVEPPHDEVFGRTFLAADPDGNLIRVSPVD